MILKLSERYTFIIVQVYAPTNDHVVYEVEELDDYITLALNDTLTHFTLICGDLNAKIGTKTDATGNGNWENLIREAGKNAMQLYRFILEKNLFQMNSFSYKKDHQRWTW